MSVLAVDMGATRIKLAAVDRGRVLAREVIPAHSDQGLWPRLPAVEEALRRLCAAVGAGLERGARSAFSEQAQGRGQPRREPEPAEIGLIPFFEGLGISFPSLVDVRTGRVVAEYGRYRDVLGIDLRAWARERLGLFAAIENDARMACIGEWRYGAGRGCDNMVMITLGTGLGTCAIIEGQVLRGKHGQAGCLGGHLTVRHGGRACGCGNAGCAEAEASTAFLGRLAAETPGWEESRLRREPTVDYAAVVRLAGSGEAFSQKLLEHSVSVWGSLAVNLIHAYDPELVVIGGGIMAGADVLLPAIRGHVERHAHTPWGKVRVVASELGDDAGTVAAEWLVTEQKKMAVGEA